MSLVEIVPEEFGVTLDIAYATARNFTGRAVYARPACYLHRDAAEALRRAVRLARGIGLGIRVFDAFRPAEAQQALWDHTPDPDFIADPRKGSPHSRGVAVDLTLTDRDGAPLAMGTAFDDFTPLSPSRQHRHRRGSAAQPVRLARVDDDRGLGLFRNEWWHYQLFDARSYPLRGDGDLPRPMM